MYRSSISVKDLTDDQIISTLENAAIKVDGLTLPPARTRRLLEKMDRCLDEMPEIPEDDDWNDEVGYSEEMNWSDWEQAGFEHEWYPNP